MCSWNTLRNYGSYHSPFLLKFLKFMHPSFFTEQTKTNGYSDPEQGDRCQPY